ncbi:hypothetical protein ACUL3X_004217 [Klebsiella oxytoca]
MLNILINTKNVYSKHAIKQMVMESITTDENVIFEDKYTQSNIAQAHIIFTEMEPGEIFLCHDELKYKKEKSLLFILQEKKAYLPKVKSLTAQKIVYFYTNPIQFL